MKVIVLLHKKVAETCSSFDVRKIQKQAKDPDFFSSDKKKIPPARPYVLNFPQWLTCLTYLADVQK